MPMTVKELVKILEDFEQSAVIKTTVLSRGQISELIANASGGIRDLNVPMEEYDIYILKQIRDKTVLIIALPN